MKALFSLLVLSFIIFAGIGSAQATQLNRCSVASAQATGAADRSDGRFQNHSYWGSCRQYTSSELQQAYNRGYSNGKAPRNHRRRHHHQTMCLTNMRDQKVCGYHCVKNNFGDVACAKKYKENCAMNNFGHIKCGMHCSVNPDTSVTCQSVSAQVQ